jgi:nitrogen fixation NifU-like protein
MSQTTFDDAADLYQRVIIDRSRSPHHMHRLDPFDASAKGDNPMCGDRVEVRIRCDGGRVTEAAFEARGCAISIASADLMADAVTGRTPAEIRDLSTRFHGMVQTGSCTECDESLRSLSSVAEYKSRIKCATLPWDALLAALEKTAHE